MSEIQRRINRMTGVNRRYVNRNRARSNARRAFSGRSGG